VKTWLLTSLVLTLNALSGGFKRELNVLEFVHLY